MEIDAATPALPSRKHGLSRLPFPVTKRQRVGSVKSSLFMSPPSHIGSSAAAGATTPPPQSGLGASTPASAAGRWRVRGLRPRDLFDSDPSQPSITQYFRPKPVNMLRRLPALALDVVHEFLAPADLLRLNTLCRCVRTELRRARRTELTCAAVAGARDAAAPSWLSREQCFAPWAMHTLGARNT